MLSHLLEKLVASPLVTDPTCPFSAQVSPAADPRVLLIVGPNSSGKSLAFQQMASWAHKAQVSPITLSIRERSGGGTFEMAGMRRAMIFGDESEQSTGATSTRVLIKGFSNIHHRAVENNRSLLMIDEPEIGLSEGYAAAMGQLIAEETLALPAGSPGVVLVTHSRPLVRRLLTGLGADHLAFVSMGGHEPMTVQDWLAGPEHQTADDLRALVDRGHAGRKDWNLWTQARNAPPKPVEPSNLPLVPPEPILLEISNEQIQSLMNQYEWDQPMSVHRLRLHLAIPTILREAALIHDHEDRDVYIADALMDAVEGYRATQALAKSRVRKSRPPHNG